MKSSFLLLILLFTSSVAIADISFFTGRSSGTNQAERLFYNGNWEKVKNGEPLSAELVSRCRKVGVYFESIEKKDLNAVRMSECHEKIYGRALLSDLNFDEYVGDINKINLNNKNNANEESVKFNPIENSCSCQGSALICSLSQELSGSCNFLENSVLAQQNQGELGKILSRVSIESTVKAEDFQVVTGNQNFCTMCIDSVADTKEGVLNSIIGLFRSKKNKKETYEELKQGMINELQEKVIVNRVKDNIKRLDKARKINRDFKAIYFHSLKDWEGSRDDSALVDKGSFYNNSCTLSLDVMMNNLPCKNTEKFNFRLKNLLSSLGKDDSYEDPVDGIERLIQEESQSQLCKDYKLRPMLKLAAFHKNEELKSNLLDVVSTAFKQKNYLQTKCSEDPRSLKDPREFIVSLLPDQSKRDEASRTLMLSMEFNAYTMAIMSNSMSFCEHFLRVGWDPLEIISPRNFKGSEAIALSKSKKNYLVESFEINNMADLLGANTSDSICLSPEESIFDLLCSDGESINPPSPAELERAAKELLASNEFKNIENNPRVALSSAVCEITNLAQGGKFGEITIQENKLLDDFINLDNELAQNPDFELITDRGADNVTTEQCNDIKSGLQELRYVTGILTGDGYYNRELIADPENIADAQKAFTRKAASFVNSQTVIEERERKSASVGDRGVSSSSVSRVFEEELFTSVEYTEDDFVFPEALKPETVISTISVEEATEIKPEVKENSLQADQLRGESTLTSLDSLTTLQTDGLVTSAIIPSTATVQQVLSQQSTEVDQIARQISDATGRDLSETKGQVAQSILNGQVTDELRSSLQGQQDSGKMENLENQIAQLTQQVQAQAQAQTGVAKADEELDKANKKIAELEERITKLTKPKVTEARKNTPNSDTISQFSKAARSAGQKNSSGNNFADSVVASTGYSGESESYKRAYNRALEKRESSPQRSVASTSGGGTQQQISLVRTNGNTQGVKVNYQNQDVVITRDNLVLSDSGEVIQVRLESGQVVDLTQPENESLKRSVEELAVEEIAIAEIIREELVQKATEQKTVVEQQKVKIEEDRKKYLDLIATLEEASTQGQNE